MNMAPGSVLITTAERSTDPRSMNVKTAARPTGTQLSGPATSGVKCGARKEV